MTKCLAAMRADWLARGLTSRVTCHLSLVTLTLLLLAGCKHRDGVKGLSGPLPDQIIEGFRLTESYSGRTLYDLNAERAYVYDDSNRISVTKPSVRFYDPQGNLTSTLTAETGTVNTKTSDLVAYTRVHVATRDSTTLDTDSLAWRNREMMVKTDAPVAMRSPDGNINGIGLVSDAGLKRIEIKNTIQATTQYEFQK